MSIAMEVMRLFLWTNLAAPNEEEPAESDSQRSLYAASLSKVVTEETPEGEMVDE